MPMWRGGGVGGGIVAVTKSGYSIATYSPALDAEGNSAAGLAAMRILARELNLGIYWA